VHKGSFIATQLNSTRPRVVDTFINSVNNCHRSVLNVLTQLRVSIATQLNSTKLDVELSWVASL